MGGFEVVQTLSLSAVLFVDLLLSTHILKVFSQYYDYGEAEGASSRHHYTDRNSWHDIRICARQLCGLFSIPLVLNRSECLGLSNGQNFYLPYAVSHRTRSRHTISTNIPNSHLVLTRVLSQRIMLPLFAMISR